MISSYNRAYALAIAFPRVPFGIDYDRRGFGAALPLTFRGAPGESARKKITAGAAIARQAKD